MAKRIDFHSHILPGLDHGSADLETSLKQLSMIAKGGTEVVLATSHFYPARMNLPDFMEKRERSLRKLQGALTAEHPKVIVGTEVACYPGLENMEGLEKLCIEGTDCMLLEMPLTAWNDAMFETVDAIGAQGIRVILAHIDRYSKERVQDIMNLDVMAQINCSSLCSFWRRRSVMQWFKQDRVWGVGSDLHGASQGGYDHFSAGLSKLDPETVARVMAHSESLLEKAVYLTDM
ncbi:MAG: histidinol-phosphatase [Ruminococcaceae bacterium]|nr:histidinol-phosphatase [Oscillospiraceae bacterium]